MSTTIFVEGGGNSEITLRSCRKGFVEYFSKIIDTRRKRLKVIACGGRDRAFDDFIAAIENCKLGDRCILLVDAEAPVTAVDAIEHLKERDHWTFPDDLNGHRVYLMAQAMEAWFLADREAMSAFYDGGFRPGSLPGRPDRIEDVFKADLEPRLKQATRDTRTKGEYHKTRHGFELLGLIDPNKVEKASAQAAILHEFLRDL